MLFERPATSVHNKQDRSSAQQFMTSSKLSYRSQDSMQLI